MGNYLECVFPFLGVRYLSVNDGYDSDDYKGMTSGMDVVLRNIIYEAYSKDLSVKTTTAKIIMMKQGKYIGSFAPYGFQFHPTVRNKLVIDGDLFMEAGLVPLAPHQRPGVLILVEDVHCSLRKRLRALCSGQSCRCWRCARSGKSRSHP